MRRRTAAARTWGAALADSEAKFRAITDAMPQMVWSARPDGHWDYFNQRWYDLTGTSPTPSQDDAWVAVVHPDDQPRAQASWQHTVQTGAPYEVEARIRMADGRYRWMLGRARPVRHPETAAVTRWFGTCTDIEDAIAAREALARSREELEQLVEERTRDLQATQARLAQVQRMEALGQLAGGIAHDFNNVLQAVQGSGALIARRAEDPEAVRRMADTIIKAAERGSAITQRLLAFARRSELRAEPVEVGALLVGMKEILVHTLGAGIEVRLDLDSVLPPLLCDKAQLETVLINLATNARDAMADQGTLTLAAAGQTLSHDAGPGEAMALKAGAYIILSVADTGSGMDAATLARVMEPFFTTKATGRGTGLGLSMARGFAEQSGGGLHIRSTPGEGTTVDLWLPLAEGAARVNGSPAQKPTPLFGKKPVRLLLVDDETIVREILAEQMEAEGCIVLAADTGDAALARVDAGEAVDLIVSDLSMPGMDGVTLIQEVHKRRPRLPAILLTGYATKAAEIAVGGAISGAFTLLRKPIDGKALAERATTLLEATTER